MPPDRTHTSASFTAAVASGAALSSAPAGHPPSLERGKCCAYLRTLTGLSDLPEEEGQVDPTSFACVYDSSVPKKAKAPQDREGSAEGQEDRVRELMAEVAALKEQLRQQAPNSSSTSSVPSAAMPRSVPTSSMQIDSNGSIPVAASSAASSSVFAAPFPSTSTSSFPYATELPPQASTSAVTVDALAPLQQPEPTYDFSLPPASTAVDPTDAPFDAATFLSARSSTSPFPPPTSSTTDSDPFGLASASSFTGTDPLPQAPPSLADLVAASTDPLFSLSALPSLSLDLSLSWALLPPSYPASLPSPGLLTRLVDVFFTKTHLATGLISEGPFRAALALPPEHKDWPLEGLLHAVCATAGLMVGEGFLDGEGRYWEGEGRRGTRGFSEWHARKAEALIDPSFDAGRHLLQVCQTAALCTFVAYTSARFTAIWSLGAKASRLAVVCGLNHIRPLAPSAPPFIPYPTPRSTGRRIREPAILPPPRDAAEQHERLSTFWAIFGADRMTAAATDWAHGIAEEDVTSLVPSLGGGGGDGTEGDWADAPLSSPLCPSSPSFFFANPPHLVGPVQIYVKTLVLLGRVCKFLQRSPEPVGSGYRSEGDEGRDLRESSAFRALERTIQHFRLSIPRDLQHQYILQTTGRLDTRLLLVHSLVQVMVILLHEPFCATPDLTAQDPSFKKCLDAAKAIVNSVYELSGSSFEIGLLASFLNWVWAVAGRTLVRALALASRRVDLNAASHLAMDVKALIEAMEANRSPVGAVTASVLTRLLADPFQVLPDSPPASSRNLKNFSSRYAPSSASATSNCAASSSSHHPTPASAPTPSFASTEGSGGTGGKLSVWELEEVDVPASGSGLGAGSAGGSMWAAQVDLPGSFAAVTGMGGTGGLQELEEMARAVGGEASAGWL
ncbi:hypothetical protein JCM10213v2_003458 [Rhodosporidiobolus nylandii]